MTLPRPRDLDAHVSALVAELAGHVGERAVVDVCCRLLAGEPREDHLDELRYLAGRSFDAGDGALDPEVWPDYWVRTWGARGLLHVWDDAATDAVVAGLADDHWRPAEMCLKVVTRHEVGGAGDAAAPLTTHELPRTRAQALRALGAVGDTEHVAAVEACLEDDDAEVRRRAAAALERLRERLDLP